MPPTAPAPPRSRPTAMLPTVPVGPGRRAAVSIAVAVVAAVVLAATYVVAVLDPAGRAVDDAVMVAAIERGAGVRDGMAMLLDAVTVPAVGLLLLALALLALLRGRPARAVGVVALVLGSQVLTQVLKAVLPRAGDVEGSLPSGHVTVVVALGVALLAVLPRAARPLVALPAVAVAALYGVATMVTGWHRPSDVVAAVAVVALVAGTAGLVGTLASRARVGQARVGDRPSTICSR